MARGARSRWHIRIRRAAVLSMAAALAVVPLKNGYALITGGEGNAPVHDPGWPKGAAKIFNDRERIAWWEGPPYGGGQWQAEYRGKAQTLNAVLDDFVNLDLKTKRVVVHDGVGQSFWLNPNQEKAKRSAAEIDWSFTVWQRDNWARLRNLPADLKPPDLGEDDKEPPAQIDVYVGGKICWASVLVPAGLELIDERLEAHGFTSADGIVLEGHAVDAATKKPLAARLRLELIDSQSKSTRYTEAAQTVADSQGHWFFKKVPAGRYRLVAEQEGYAARVVGYKTLDGQPGWHRSDCRLSRAASLSGRVTDEAGRPLADVVVQLRDILPEGSTSGYRLPTDELCKTDAQGRFGWDQAPIGKARIMLSKAGYLLRGLGPTISIPVKDAVFKMEKSAQIGVTVEFPGNRRPTDYLVEIEPATGGGVGTWGGSGSIDQQNQIVFTDVPPGRYVIQGHPNPYTPSSEGKVTPIAIEVKGGQSAKAKLLAK